ncbi:MAG: glycosyltransferase [Dysgonamonadaceae bacterium]|jgi:glycosyltransferase involved in cell wall biosynthesis|nr:glycosyltransferase [Dysgonamonadaceae bacterium]
MKLSVITVNRNNANGLEKTIQSVVCQKFTDYEYIIIDGNSTDGSIDIIKKYANSVHYWMSESDNGIFHAMNKGISHAKGEYVIFMNSGDRFYDGEVLLKVFSKEQTGDLLAGNVIFDKKIKEKKILPQKITFYFFMTDTIPHQGCFIRRTLFDEIGLYNEQIAVSSDWIFFLLAVVKYQKSLTILNEYIALREPNGIASSLESYRCHKLIQKETIEKYFPYLYDDYCELHRLKRFSFHRLKQFVKGWFLRKIF